MRNPTRIDRINTRNRIETERTGLRVVDVPTADQLDQRLPEIDPKIEFCNARDDEHPAIRDFLVSVFQGPSTKEYRHTLEAPRYESLDRLLLKRHDEIVAHLQLVHRTIQFGDFRVPSIDIRHLGTLPEYRSKGLASRLLHHAEYDTNLHGALLATVNATSPTYFLSRGWVPWMIHSESSASPRSLLAELGLPSLNPTPELRRSANEKISIRLWRRHELDALRRLFDSEKATRYGGLARDESDWNWLISGQGYDRIYVAVRKSQQSAAMQLISDDDDTVTMHADEGNIIGYAVIRHDHIVEMIAEPETGAAVALLKHACADCIENGHSSIRIDAAPEDPIHDQFQAASGIHRQRQQRNGSMLLAKLIRPVEFLRRMSDVLLNRAVQQGLSLPQQLGIAIGPGVSARTVRINLSKRSVNVVEGKLPTDCLSLDLQGFNMLLLGQANISELIKGQRAYATTRAALDMGLALFPNLPGWRMPWGALLPLER